MTPCIRRVWALATVVFVAAPAEPSDELVAIDGMAQEVDAVDALLASPNLAACLEGDVASNCGDIANELSAARTRLDFQRAQLAERVQNPEIQRALDATLSRLCRQLAALVHRARVRTVPAGRQFDTLVIPDGTAPKEEPTAPTVSIDNQDIADNEVLVLRGAIFTREELPIVRDAAELRREQ